MCTEDLNLKFLKIVKYIVITITCIKAVNVAGCVY